MSNTADELLDLLDRERALLVGGQFEDLDQMARSKEALMRRLTTISIPQSTIERLRARAEANARLLGAAAAGLRAALDRINCARGPAPALETYAANGLRTRLGTPRPRHERRA